MILFDKLGKLWKSLLDRSRSTATLKPQGASSSRTLVLPGFDNALALLRSAMDEDFALSTGNWWLRTFTAFVLAPTLVFFLYAALWQSNRYEAEARIAVRGAQEFRGSVADASGIISKITGGGAASKSTLQDAYIVLNYIKSPAIILDLGGTKYMEKWFSASDIDYFSRLPLNATIEELVKYWLKRVTASVDTVSGIITVKVEAFSSANASDVAQHIIRRSESLINTITERSRRDAVARAEQEILRAADRLGSTRGKLTAFRDTSMVFDPATRAKNVAETIAKLTMDKIAIEGALATLESSLRSDSPTQRIQQAKLTTINQQIDALNKSLTSPNDANALSAQIATYERLKLDEQFDELMYTIAQSSYQRARQELERMQLYLAVVVPPNTPEKATYPKVVVSSLLLFTALFIFWSIAALITASMQDQML